MLTRYCRKILRLLFCFGILINFSAKQSTGQELGKNFAILIGGTGWSEEYSEKYYRYLLETRKAMVDKFGFDPENVIVLAEEIPAEENYVNDISRSENIRNQFDILAGRVTDKDHIYVILFGHGSFDGVIAKFNIPGRDLSSSDFAKFMDSLKANRIIFVNTTQSSFPFIASLSAHNRIIITATKSGTQKTETRFPGYFVEALNSPASDLDKNGNLTVLEVFTYSSEMTSRWFEERNHLATEHPQLEDTGDRQAFRLEELEENAEGILASITYFKRRAAVVSSLSSPADSALFELLVKQEQVELEIANLKTAKNQYAEVEYYERLEVLLINLARISEEIEKIKKSVDF